MQIRFQIKLQGMFKDGECFSLWMVICIILNLYYYRVALHELFLIGNSTKVVHNGLKYI